MQRDRCLFSRSPAQTGGASGPATEIPKRRLWRIDESGERGGATSAFRIAPATWGEEAGPVSGRWHILARVARSCTALVLQRVSVDLRSPPAYSPAAVRRWLDDACRTRPADRSPEAASGNPSPRPLPEAERGSNPCLSPPLRFGEGAGGGVLSARSQLVFPLIRGGRVLP